jgi:hypothetical protein
VAGGGWRAGRRPRHHHSLKRETASDCDRVGVAGGGWLTRLSRRLRRLARQPRPSSSLAHSSKVAVWTRDSQPAWRAAVGAARLSPH